MSIGFGDVGGWFEQPVEYVAPEPVVEEPVQEQTQPEETTSLFDDVKNSADTNDNQSIWANGFLAGILGLGMSDEQLSQINEASDMADFMNQMELNENPDEALGVHNNNDADLAQDKASTFDIAGVEGLSVVGDDEFGSMGIDLTNHTDGTYSLQDANGNAYTANIVNSDNGYTVTLANSDGSKSVEYNSETNEFIAKEGDKAVADINFKDDDSGKIDGLYSSEYAKDGSKASDSTTEYYNQGTTATNADTESNATTSDAATSGTNADSTNDTSKKDENASVQDSANGIKASATDADGKEVKTSGGYDRSSAERNAVAEHDNADGVTNGIANEQQAKGVQLDMDRYFDLAYGKASSEVYDGFVSGAAVCDIAKAYGLIDDQQYQEYGAQLNSNLGDTEALNACYQTICNEIMSKDNASEIFASVMQQNAGNEGFQKLGLDLSSVSANDINANALMTFGSALAVVSRDGALEDDYISLGTSTLANGETVGPATAGGDAPAESLTTDFSKDGIVKNDDGTFSILGHEGLKLDISEPKANVNKYAGNYQTTEFSDAAVEGLCSKNILESKQTGENGYTLTDKDGNKYNLVVDGDYVKLSQLDGDGKAVAVEEYSTTSQEYSKWTQDGGLQYDKGNVANKVTVDGQEYYQTNDGKYYQRNLEGNDKDMREISQDVFEEKAGSSTSGTTTEDASQATESESKYYDETHHEIELTEHYSNDGWEFYKEADGTCYEKNPHTGVVTRIQPSAYEVFIKDLESDLK